MNTAIICEGKNDKDFLIEIIEFLNFNSKDIDFYIFGGKSLILKSTHDKYNELKNEIEQVDKILFVIDADYDDKKKDNIHGGFKKTQLTLNSVIEELSLKDLSQTYIMCDPETKTGYLESLILSTLEDNQKKCIECFLKCTGWNPKKGDKTVYHRLYKTGYPDPQHNFKHKNFDDLKNKLCDLFAE